MKPHISSRSFTVPAPRPSIHHHFQMFSRPQSITSIMLQVYWRSINYHAGCGFTLYCFSSSPRKKVVWLLRVHLELMINGHSPHPCLLLFWFSQLCDIFVERCKSLLRKYHPSSICDVICTRNTKYCWWWFSTCTMVICTLKLLASSFQTNEMNLPVNYTMYHSRYLYHMGW